MLFSCLAYLAFGLMYAYEEVLKEMRNVNNRADFNFLHTDVMPQMSLKVPFTANEYRIRVSIKYARLIGTLMFITIGLAMYSMRRIKIMRAIGNLKNEDALRIVYKRVNTFKLDYQMTNSLHKLSTVGGGAAVTIDDTETDKDTL
jgi:tetrahydromethanopterin S-methyltransferase subunit G